MEDNTFRGTDSRDSEELKISKKINLNGLGWFVTGLFVVGDLAGGGLVALPTAMIRSELWFGIGICMLMTAVVMYTAHVLGLCWNILLDTWPEYHEHCRKPYPEIGRRAMGPFVMTLVSICIDVTQFMSAVVYVLLSAKNIHDFFKTVNDGNSISYCIVIIILAFCLLPVTFLKSPQDFWWAVILAMITTSCAVVLVCVGAAKDWGTCAPARHMPSPKVTNYFLALGTFLFAYGGHNTFPTVQHDMKNPREFTKSAIVAFSIITSMYLPVSIMGYLVYGGSLKDSVIPSIQTTWMQQAINLLIAVHCILTLTIVFNPLNQEMEHIFRVKQSFGPGRIFVRTGIMIAVVFVSESIPTFGPLLDLVGGSTLTLSSVILPCLFYLYLSSARTKEKETGIRNRNPCTIKDVIKYTPRTTLVICCSIMIFGIIGGGAATFSALRELTTTSFEQPCYVSAFNNYTRTQDSTSSTNCCGQFQNLTRNEDPAKCSPYSNYFE